MLATSPLHQPMKQLSAEHSKALELNLSNKMEEAKAYASGNRKRSRNGNNHRGTSIIRILSAAAPGLHASSAFFMGSDAPVPAGVRFALVFERGIHEHCAVQMSTLHPTNACQSLPVRAM